MSKEKAKKTRKIYKGEAIWYSILGCIWLIGFVFSILGVLAYNVGSLDSNPLYQAEKGMAKAFKHDGAVCDFRIFGAIVMIVAMIIILIVVYYYVSKASKEEAEKRRKEERLRILQSDDTSSTEINVTEKVETK